MPAASARKQIGEQLSRRLGRFVIGELGDETGGTLAGAATAPA